jgi:hypothetical protein
MKFPVNPTKASRWLLTNMINPISKIPYLGLPDTPILSTTQEFIPIADITDDLVITKDGSAAVVMESTSLNFSLLSEKEQQAVIYAYGALLNSLSFPIQVMVRSQVKDISKYLSYLDEARTRLTNPKLIAALDNYKLFINTTIKKRNVLGKSFYVVIPFSSLELGVAKSAVSLTKKKSGPLPYPKSYVVKKAKVALYPKRDHLMRQAARLGIRLRQLSTEELIRLYYYIFNGEPPTSRRDEVKT